MSSAGDVDTIELRSGPINAAADTVVLDGLHPSDAWIARRGMRCWRRGEEPCKLCKEANGAYHGVRRRVT